MILCQTKGLMDVPQSHLISTESEQTHNKMDDNDTESNKGANGCTAIIIE